MQGAMAMEAELNREGRGKVRETCTDGSSSVIRWERFLPKMAVRVLLVEADDSTRQIISALLRKCNYKVAAVPDGLKAWEVLKAKPRKIDLILTEVELSSISGFALLTLIMEDELCKNIPVIMMSSHDSIGTVYKCMMRGASDFLMKPIRINELKNMWQHVWRRQSTRIGEELCGGLMDSAEQQKEEATGENGAASERSKRDAQSSRGKPDLEAKSALARVESRHLPGSRIIKSLAAHTLNPQYDAGSGKCLVSHANVDHQMVDNRLVPQASENAVEPSREEIDLIGTLDVNKGSSRNVDSTIGPKLFEPELSLSLTGSQVGDFENNPNQNNNVLIHSNASAFSRYTNKTLQIEPIQEHTPYSLRHHSADRATLRERDFISVDQYGPQEQRVENMEEKTCFSPATDQSWSESFCNVDVSHSSRCGNLRADNGDMDHSVPLRAESENGNIDRRIAHSGRNSQRSVQREAALAKFRLKRKERCYEKKVRYESRKKLADQRPRVKGQFVCRIPPDPPPPLANPKTS